MNSASPSVLCQLEKLTEGFRFGKAKEHDAKAADARRLYFDSVDDWTEALGAIPRRRGDAWEPPRPTVLVGGFRMDAVEWAKAGAERAQTTEKWHAERARGQRKRFLNLSSCCVRVRTTMCNMCGFESTRRPVPDGCGVSRLCARCSLFGAKKRRSRFGRARAQTIVTAPKHVHRKKRKGGAYGETMLTLTVPHFSRDALAARLEELDRLSVSPDEDDSRRAKWARWADAAREILGSCRDTVMCRVQAIWNAWPRFVRKLSRWWRSRGETLGGGTKGPLLPRMHRAAEWVPGSDQQGHPHFHVWVWSSFLPERQIKRMWTEALFECGVPPSSVRTPDGFVILNLKKIYGFDNKMAAELLKGGRREALTLSRIRTVERNAGGEDVFSYAEGWTIHEVIERSLPEVVASLYEVLEGKRLTQASRGFFGKEPPKMCPWCHCGKDVFGFENVDIFRTTFATATEEQIRVATACAHGRDPP